MNLFQKINLYFQIYFDKLKNFHTKIKRIIWNKNILLWWYRLWIRKDEFHISLSMDPEAMLEMNREEIGDYCNDLMKRRNIAHERDLDSFVQKKS